MTLNNTQDFVNLFTTTTGELFYFIAIFIIYQAALLMSFDQRRRADEEIAAGRYVVALWLALAAWLILISSTIFSLLNDNTGILPPLESTVNTIVIVALSYGLLTAEYHGKIRIETAFSLGLVAVLLAGLAYTLQTWDSNQDFYEQSISVSWVYLTLVLCGGSIVLLFWRYRNVADIPLKFLFFVTIIVGHVYTLRQQLLNERLGDASGAIRWSLMFSGLLLVMVIYRMVIERMTHAVDTVATYAEHISRPLKAVGFPRTSSQEFEAMSERITAETAGTSGLGGRNEAMALLKALGIMLDKADTNAIPLQTVQAVSDVLKADIVGLVTYEDANWADIVAAYDFGRKRPIAGMSINLNDQPTLYNALEQKRQQRLDSDTHATELKDLYARFDMPVFGSTYFQPLVRNGVVVGALIVGFPYTRRDLRSDEQRLLESIAPIAARLVMISRAARIERVQAEERAILQLVEGIGDQEYDDSNAAMIAVRREMQASFEMAQQEIDLLNEHIQKLESDLRKERQKLEEVIGHDHDDDAVSITQRVEAITFEREQLQIERRQLAAALKEAQATLIGATADDEVAAYRSMNEQLQEELVTLRQQRNRLAQQLAALKTDGSATERVQNLLNALVADQSQLEANREQMQAKLEDTQTQLTAIGLQADFQGLMDQITKLKEEREYYKNQAQKAAHERELLLKERKRLEQAIEQEQERTARIQALEAQIARLSEDREVLIKQRNHLSSQRDSLTSAAKDWHEERTTLLDQQNALRQEKEAALAALSEATEAQQHLISERNILQADNERLQHEYQALLARVDGDRERLNRINDEGFAPMQQMISDLSQARSDLEAQLNRANQQIAVLERQLDSLRASNGHSHDLPVDMDVIVSLAQELRSPLSVIMGYTDTVLGESVGILGALQRKLLTRVKANVDRLAYLVEELVQIAIMDSGGMRLEPKKVNMVDFIDDAIAAIRYRFGEKGIVLDLDIADDNIYLQADEEALRQIVNHLIQNAYLVSPTDGSVKISAQQMAQVNVPGSNPQVLTNVVLVAIQDHGGGIRPEDEARVFTRMYRAENPLIEGLGDIGVGMSITKALIEAHGGRIWLTSERDQGANTFIFAIPIQQPILQASHDAALVD